MSDARAQMLKSKLGAYDGRGNHVVRSKADVDAAFKKLGAQNLYAERMVTADGDVLCVSCVASCAVCMLHVSGVRVRYLSF